MTCCRSPSLVPENRGVCCFRVFVDLWPTSQLLYNTPTNVHTYEQSGLPNTAQLPSQVKGFCMLSAPGPEQLECSYIRFIIFTGVDLSLLTMCSIIYRDREETFYGFSRVVGIEIASGTALFRSWIKFPARSYRSELTFLLFLKAVM